MSTLKVSNVHFEATGSKRIDYLNDDVLRISFGETIFSGNGRFDGNGATKLSVGTTTQRPTGETGLIRFNTSTGTFEGHNGSAWGSIGGGGFTDLSPANNWANTVASASAVAANTVASASTDAANTLSATRTNAANGWANTVASASAVAANTLSTTQTNAANGWANTVASASAVAANTLSTTRTNAANGWANTVASASAVAANTLSTTQTNAANGWANTVASASAVAANTLSETRTNAANGLANTVASASAVAANTLSATRTNAANGWANTVASASADAANTLSLTRSSAANGWANTVSPVGGQQTIWIPSVAMIPRTTSGAALGTTETATNRVMIKTLDFDTTTQEFCQFAIQMPKSWNESTIICQFVWSHSNTITNFGVAWNVAAVSLADADSLDSAFGTAITVVDTGGTNNAIYISNETAAVTVAGSPLAEEYVVFQVSRWPANASDTLGIDARLHGVKVHYTVDAAKDD